MRALVLLAALAVAGCATTRGPVAVPLDPLPASICAPPEPEPQGPAITPDQQTAGDVGVIRALGEALGIAIIQHREVTHPAWGRRQAERVRAGAEYCAAR